MEFIFDFILFCLACYVSFYLPGKLILSRVFRLSPTHTSFLSWSVGVGFFLLGIYIGAWMHLPYLYLGILVAIVVFAFLRDRSLFKIAVKTDDLVSLGIILLGSVVFLSLTAFSYIQTKSGLQFVGTINVIDGLLHIGNTNALLTTFPPQHIGLAGIPLRGYHYFYDLLMSRFVLFFHFTPANLYYRYLPLFISILYGGGFYLLTTKLTGNKLSQRLVLFFAYFAQSFAFVLSFFIHSIGSTAELGSIYPLELILNPAIILSIGMLLCFVFLLLESKPKLWQMVMIGFSFGIITELKVYTGIIGVSVFAIIIFLRVIKKREGILPYFLGLMTMGIVILITYVPNNFGAGSLWFSPFFAYSVYMQEPPFTSWHWEMRRIIFRDHHNIPHLIVSYGEAIGLFWLLSLGSRIVLILGLPTLLKKSFWKEEKYIAIFAMIVVPILIGSLFVQSISIFDTKQFFWIAGCLIAIPAGIVVGNLLHKRKYLIQTLVIMLLIFFSAGGIIGQLNAFVFKAKPYIILSADEIFLQNVTKRLPGKNEILYILQPNSNTLASFPFNLGPVIASMTEHPTYIEAENTISFGKIYDERKKRLNNLKELLSISCNTKKIKKTIMIIGARYVISPKDKCLEKVGTPMEKSSSGLTLYFIKI